MSSLANWDALGSEVPKLALKMPATHPRIEGRGVGYVLVNFNTSGQTMRCIDSLAAMRTPPEWVLVLDNNSAWGDYRALIDGLRRYPCSEVLVYRSSVNLGFAAGTNFLVARLLETPHCEFIGLLNNDAVADAALTDELLSVLSADPALAGMAGGRMHKLGDRTLPDSLGIAIYANLMPGDRLDSQDTYMGPTGGCCLITRACARDIISATGYFFDPRFFCYSEDTDLVLRAVMLGYRPAYSDRLVAFHEGQASSRRVGDTFLLYHSWRNTLWMHLKITPARVLLRRLPTFLYSQMLSGASCVLRGKLTLLARVCWHVLREVPTLLAERRELAKVWRAGAPALEARMSRQFYRSPSPSAPPLDLSKSCSR